MLLARDERLVEFSFASRLDANVGPDAMLRLARQSWSDNQRAGVTGFLRLEAGRVDQTVEGPSTAILALAARILTDRRHGEIVIRRFGPIAARRHPEWFVSGLDDFGLHAARAPAARVALRLLSGATAALPRGEAQPLAAGRAT